MKKTITIISAVLLTVCFFTGCGALGAAFGKTDDRVPIAIEALDEQWDDYRIKNTRIIDLKENDVAMFDDIDYIVEFVLYTDYFGSAPYYSNAGIYDTVSVYSDGHAEVNEWNLFDLYRSTAYVTDFSDIIEDIEDLGDSYNN